MLGKNILMSSLLPGEPPEGVSMETLIFPAPPSCIVNTPLGFIVGTYTIDREEQNNNIDHTEDNESDLPPIRHRTGSLCVVKPIGVSGYSNL